MLEATELPNNLGSFRLADMSIAEDWVDYIITKLGKKTKQSWMSMIGGMTLVEWFDIAYGYSAVVHSLRSSSDLMGLALVLKRHCTVCSFIVKMHSMS